jgi:hypothetical protein
MERITILTALLSTLSLPAYAYGPGMHCREADVVLDLLADSDPFWSGAVEADWARPYLSLGSMSPDFEYAVDGLTFGHSKGLSYHLLAAAEEMPVQYSLFALGHLAHAGGGDAASEQFVGPTVFAMEPLGMFDIVAGQDGARGESEGITEGFGDLMTGDYHRVADAFWFFWLEGEEAEVRGEDILYWYCQEGSSYSGTNTDCDLVWTGFQDLLAQVEGLLGGFDYQGTHDLIEMLLNQSPEDLADLVFAGSMGAFLDFEVTVGEHTEQEKDRIKNSILMDPSFWDFYEEMALIGPSATVFFYQNKPPASTWPTWSDKPQMFGNIRSVMNFLPESFAPWPNLIIDYVAYSTAEGAPVTAVGEAQKEEGLLAIVRLYAAFPFSGTVHGIVRRDQPGLDQANDDIVGEASLEMDVDPATYGEVQRDTLTIPFVAEADGAMGFYVELYYEEDTLPWFSTSWDAIYPSGVLPFNWTTYLDNFGTYGHWPPSLPVADAIESGATLFATVRVAPTGGGISGAEVSVNDTTHFTLDNGIAAVEGLATGDYAISATAAGYETGNDGLLKVTMTEGEATWYELFFHAIPQIELPSPWYAGECGEVSWPVEPFSGQVDFFTVRLSAGEFSDDIVEEQLVTNGVAEFCPPLLPDGALLQLSVQATYKDGTKGVTGWSEPFQLLEVPVEPPIEVVEAPIEQVEWQGDIYVADETVNETVDQTWETVGEAEVTPDLFEAEPTAKAKFSSGCAARPTGTSNTNPLTLMVLLLVFGVLRRPTRAT